MKRKISLFLAFVMIVCVCSGCTQTQKNTATESAITAVSPVDETVELHTFSQSSFLEGSDSMIRLYANGIREKSRPKAVKFEWKYEGSAQDEPFTLHLSENADMQDSKLYTTEETNLSVYNLKIATTYYWTVSVQDTVSAVASFTTSDQAPRNLYIDGITNARDLGGWPTENGTRTKQGMIFRCGRLNESDTETVNIEITESGKQTMLEDLGIQTEIDVRFAHNNETGGITSSPLGDSVTYINCPMDWNGDMLQVNREQIIQVFSVLSDADNYPLFIHCNIGTDRTGMLSFLINALLGVSEENLYKDYLFSNFGDINGNRPLDNLLNSDYYQALQQADGATLSEKTYNCLLDVGVPAAHLDSVIALLSA